MKIEEREVACARVETIPQNEVKEVTDGKGVSKPSKRQSKYEYTEVSPLLKSERVCPLT